MKAIHAENRHSGIETGGGLDLLETAAPTVSASALHKMTYEVAKTVPGGHVVDSWVREAVKARYLLIWCVSVLNALYVVGLIVSGGINPILNLWLAPLTQWIPVIMFWVVARRTAFRRWDVILAAMGVTINAVTVTYHCLALDGDGYLALPSVADIGYVSFYPLMIAALVVLVRRQVPEGISAVVLNSAVAALGAATVLVAILGPAIGSDASRGYFLANAVAVAYPLLDVVVIATIVGIAATPALSAGRRWWALVCGLLIFAVGDIAYAYLDSSSSYLSGMPRGFFWALGLSFLAWWADSLESADAPVDKRRNPFAAQPIPAVAVIVAITALLLGTRFTMPTLSLVFAALTVGVAAIPIVFHQAMLNRLVAGQLHVADQLERLDSDKSEMMVTLNHEMRTPLTSIRGYLELVLDGEGGTVPPAAAEMVRVIERNTDRLQSLVDDMLLVSKLDAGALAASSVPVDVSLLLERVVVSLESVATSRGVHLAFTNKAARIHVHGDEKQLQRAFFSLVDNAVKFTPAGGSVAIGIENDGESEREWARVSVVDTGIGIPSDELPMLFDRFFRASNARTAAVPGAGLGLAIASSVIKSHGGKIHVESSIGRGTTVLVELLRNPAATPNDLLAWSRS